MTKRMLMTGASGLIGRDLTEHLSSHGWQVDPLVRRADLGKPFWRPERGELDPAQLEGYDAVVHLAGENIAGGRWTSARKARIRDSRVEGTALLAGALARLESPPRCLVCASAVGLYGDRGDERLGENAVPGTGYLAEVASQWEAAAEPARAAGIRVVHARLGMVLSRKGGALKKMLPVFRLGLGGRLGPGTQWVSWIAGEDVIRAFMRLVEDESLDGAFNLVAPEPVTNADFTRALGRVLRRPTIFPAPPFALRLVLGEMADALLLSSTRAMPDRLLVAGFKFSRPEIETALRAELAP